MKEVVLNKSSRDTLSREKIVKSIWSKIVGTEKKAVASRFIKR